MRMIILIVFLILISCLYAVNAVEDSFKKEAFDLKESVKKGVYSGNWKFVHAQIRFFYFWANLFGGNTCGDNVCGEAENCLDDCGSFYLKNDLFNGEKYNGEINFRNEDYFFELTGKCYYKDDSSEEDKMSKGGYLSDIEINVKHGSDGDSIFSLEEGEGFELSNGESFYVDGEGCLPGGFVEIVSENPICGDGVCWKGDCLQDCGGRFSLVEGTEKTINYDNMDYTISLERVGGTDADPIVNFAFHYKSADGLVVKENFEVTFFDDIVLRNKLRFWILSFYQKDNYLLNSNLAIWNEVPNEEKSELIRIRESIKNPMIINHT